MRMVRAPGTVQLLEADPDLGALLSDARRAEAERELTVRTYQVPDGRLGRRAPERHVRRPRRPADPRRRALARADGRRPGQRRAARPGRRDPALADRQPGEPAPRRGRVVGALAGHRRRARPPLRGRAGALPRDHLGAARPLRRALDPPRHHAGDLAADPRRPPPARALLAPRRALGPRLGPGRDRAAGAHAPHPRPARRRPPADRLDRAGRARRARRAGAPAGRLVAAARRSAGRRDARAPPGVAAPTLLRTARRFERGGDSPFPLRD